jgi:hypothetical protein
MENLKREKLVLDTCLILVQHFRNIIEADIGGFHTRIFNYILHPEYDFVGVGQSIEVIKQPNDIHYEHIVPCAVLISETERLIKEGKLSDDAIASLLHEHWKIAKITKAQAKTLDSKATGLKSKMPKEWCFGGNTYARLDECDIKLS